MTELEKIEAAEERLKELLTEARGMIKDLRNEQKRLEEFVKDSIKDKIEVEVETGLDKYKRELELAIKQATAAVFRRFDTIMNTLLGEDHKTKMSGKETLEELLVIFIEQERRRDNRRT